MEQIQEFENEARNDLIEGRNAVMEALRAGRTIDKIFIAKGDVDKTLGHIASKARSAGIVVTEADRRKLDAMSQTHAHQGVIALCAVKEYSTIEDMLAIAAERGEAPFLVLCDEISDPHNLGAIIRTAECVGAHGVIIPKRRSAGLTAVVDKTSAGALEHMAVARVPNLAAAIETLKKNGLWIYGTAAEGANELWKTDLTGPACIVIGSEGTGISRLVREKCDFLVSIPLRGQISSLNASAAAAVLLRKPEIWNMVVFNLGTLSVLTFWQLLLMGHQTGVWWQFAGLVFTNIAQIVGSRLGMLRLHPRSGDIAILVLIVSAVVLAATPMPAVRILAFFVFSCAQMYVANMISSSLHESIDDSIRATAFSVGSLVLMAFTAVVTPLCGYIADTFSISWGTLTTIPLLVALLIAGLARKPESDKRVKVDISLD